MRATIKVKVQHRLLSFACCMMMSLTLIWGGCVSCEQYFMVGGGARQCCAPNGHCKSKPGSPSRAEIKCSQIAAEQQQIAVVVVPQTQWMKAPVPVVAGLDTDFLRRSPQPLDTSPPDLFTLHSSYLI